MAKKVKTNNKGREKKIAWLFAGVIATVIILGSVFSCTLEVEADDSKAKILFIKEIKF